MARDFAHESCGLCAEAGIKTPAVADIQLPWPNAPWAFVCKAHDRRVLWSSAKIVETLADIRSGLRVPA